jgi:hypothetical protein
VASLCVAPRLPAIYGNATTPMDVFKITINVGTMTASAPSHGLMDNRPCEIAVEPLSLI